MKEDTIYMEFITWLGKTWWELPESEHLMPMIKANYTPEEAAFLTGFPYTSTSLEHLAEARGISPEDLELRLTELGRKGMIYKSKRGVSVRYRLNDTFMALLRANNWPGHTDQRQKVSAPAINKYMLDNWFEQYNEVHHRGLRTLPIAQTIKDVRSILPYEDAVKVVEGFEYYTVSTCPCRHRHNLDPGQKDCPHPTETCLHFDDLGRYIVEHDLGREITKEETLDILKKSADSGLVHGISTWQKNPDTICNCCSCCCLFLESYHKLGHAKSLDPSNYRVVVEAETCKACGLCVKRCPMDALQLKYSALAKNKFGKAVAVDEDLCLGCGVCVHKCPTRSLKLEQCDEIKPPPETVRDYMHAYMNDRLAAKKDGKKT
jgi:NAD-dependent dihydropyrimidine dehydrogenase PreA subunit